MKDLTINGEQVTVGDISSDLLLVGHRDDVPEEVKQICTNAYLMIAMMVVKMSKAGIVGDDDG